MSEQLLGMIILAIIVLGGITMAALIWIITSSRDKTLTFKQLYWYERRYVWFKYLFKALVHQATDTPRVAFLVTLLRWLIVPVFVATAVAGWARGSQL